MGKAQRKRVLNTSFLSLPISAETPPRIRFFRASLPPYLYGPVSAAAERLLISRSAVIASVLNMYFPDWLAHVESTGAHNIRLTRAGKEVLHRRTLERIRDRKRELAKKEREQQEK